MKKHDFHPFDELFPYWLLHVFYISPVFNISMKTTFTDLSQLFEIYSVYIQGKKLTSTAEMKTLWSIIFHQKQFKFILRSARTFFIRFKVTEFHQFSGTSNASKFLNRHELVVERLYQHITKL